MTSDCNALLMSLSASVALSFMAIYAIISHETERMGGWVFAFNQKCRRNCGNFGFRSSATINGSQIT